MGISLRLWAGIFLLALAVVASGWMYLGQGGSEKADPLDARQVAVGSEVYQRVCASCHGRNLEGQENWRSPLPAGGLPAPPHDEAGHTWHHPDDILFRVTKHGGAVVAPAGFQSNMPAFAPILSDDEIWAVLAFIKSRWPEAIRNRQKDIDARYRSSR
jgi:mono/diheme cytochrome c family protein